MPLSAACFASSLRTVKYACARAGSACGSGRTVRRVGTGVPRNAQPAVRGRRARSTPADRSRAASATMTEATDRPFQLSYPTPAPGATPRPRGAVDCIAFAGIRRAVPARSVPIPCRFGSRADVVESRRGARLAAPHFAPGERSSCAVPVSPLDHQLHRTPGRKHNRLARQSGVGTLLQECAQGASCRRWSS